MDKLEKNLIDQKRGKFRHFCSLKRVILRRENAEKEEERRKGEKSETWRTRLGDFLYVACCTNKMPRYNPKKALAKAAGKPTFKKDKQRESTGLTTVSYTHLTLPTILLV